MCGFVIGFRFDGAKVLIYSDFWSFIPNFAVLTHEITMMETLKQQFDLSMMPVNETAITLGDDMLVMDTLAHPMSMGLNDSCKRFPMKLHMTCMLIVVEGEVKYSVNIHEFVASNGTCALIREGVIIDNVICSGSARIIQLMFSQKGIASSNSTPHRLYVLPDEHIIMLKGLYSMLRVILNERAFDNTRGEAAVNCVRFMRSIIEDESGHKDPFKNKSTRKDEIVARFLDCVNEHYREHRELGFYADQLSLSLKYMSQIIYGQTGRHPSQWIKDYVILDAKTMLRSGRYTIQQVAEELHFPNQSFFGKYFKEAVGVSPKKWK